MLGNWYCFGLLVREVLFMCSADYRYFPYQAMQILDILYEVRHRL